MAFLEFFGLELANSVVQSLILIALNNRHLILLRVLQLSLRQNSIKSCLVDNRVKVRLENGDIISP